MTDAAIAELQMLRQEVAMLVTSLSPWVTTTEMCARYDCIPKTLANMERDGRIPWRKQDKWSRAELIQWEAKRFAKRAA